MIVNWKKEKAGVLVAPVMKDKKIIKQLYILPGHNDVPNEDWLLARTHKAMVAKIKLGTIVEVGVEEKIKPVKVKVSKETSVESGDLNAVSLYEKDSFPYNDVVSILKEGGLYKAVLATRKEAGEKGAPSKDWFIAYLNGEDGAECKALIEAELLPKEINISEEELNGSEEIELTIPELQEMPPQTATDIITDTYNLETLDKWKAEVSQPDLRVLILNQIEEVNKPNPNNKKK